MHFEVSYRRRSLMGGIERAVGGMSPRAASTSCYIDRRTCDSDHTSNMFRATGKDTPEIETFLKSPFAVYSANIVTAASVRRSTAKIYTYIYRPH